MEIDLTSIIIGITALATFFVPIGLYQLSVKQKINQAQKAFDSAVQKYELGIDKIEILRGGIAIGIDSTKKIVLHVKNGTEMLIELKEVAGCKNYNHQWKITQDDGSTVLMQEQGIQLTFQNLKDEKVNLIMFQGKEGSTLGDESFIIEKWMGRIKTVLNKA